MTRNLTFAKAAFGAALSAVLSQTVPAAAADACLQPKALYSWKPFDDRTVIVTDLARHKFKVGLMGICENIKWNLGLGFKSFSSSQLSCLQRGDSVVVGASGGLPPQTCPIQTVQAYTPEMEHADAVAKAMDKPH